MPAHRLTVDDCPARPPDLADEAVPHLQRVLQEPIRAVVAAAVARSGPRIAVGRQVRSEW